MSVSGVCILGQENLIVMSFSKISLSTLVCVFFKDQSMSVTTIRVQKISTFDVYSSFFHEKGIARKCSFPVETHTLILWKTFHQCEGYEILSASYPTCIYLFKVDQKKKCKTSCGVCSKLTIKSKEQIHWCW